MQTVYFYFDDSGTFHKNEPSGYFLYAGYVFCNVNDRDIAKRKYINANKKIRQATGKTGELKASVLEAKYKRALFNSTRSYESVSAAVNLSRIYDHILEKKKSRCRYKDYILSLIHI